MDSADEQAAAIRRELDGRMQKVNEMEKVQKEIINTEASYVKIIKFYIAPVAKILCADGVTRLRSFDSHY